MYDDEYIAYNRNARVIAQAESTSKSVAKALAKPYTQNGLVVLIVGGAKYSETDSFLCYDYSLVMAGNREVVEAYYKEHYSYDDVDYDCDPFIYDGSD